MKLLDTIKYPFNLTGKKFDQESLTRFHKKDISIEKKAHYFYHYNYSEIISISVELKENMQDYVQLCRTWNIKER